MSICKYSTKKIKKKIFEITILGSTVFIKTDDVFMEWDSATDYAQGQTNLTGEAHKEIVLEYSIMAKQAYAIATHTLSEFKEVKYFGKDVVHE